VDLLVCPDWCKEGVDSCLNKYSSTEDRQEKG